MTGLELFRIGLEVAVVAVLALAAFRLRKLEHAVDGLRHPVPDQESTQERKPRMSLSANARRQHGLALVRRTIASGKYTKKDVARWEDEFGAGAIQALLPDAKQASASKPTQSDKSESKE